MSAATIVHDPSEAVALCPALGLYLKPITKMAISVSLPPLRQPGKSISNWEVMERLKAMAGARDAPFSALRIAKSTLDFIRFEGEVENRGLVRAALAALDGKTIKLSGFADALRVRAAEFRADFPSRHDWDSFFRDAADMNEALPGERPDTIHLEGLPCRWFAARETPPAPTSGTTSGSAPASGATSGPAPTSGAGSGVGPAPRLAPTSAPGPASVASSASGPERPSEAVLRQVFGAFGEIRHVDIPMLDPYREEMAGRSFHTFSFGGHLNFEAYVQYREYAGFARAMAALRGMKLMLKGDDGKAVACGIKVTFDATKHLSEASIRRRAQERQKLQELELQREEQKRREREAEERRRAEERKQREAEEQERERRREEKLRRREQRARAREQRRSRRRVEKLRAEEQRRLRGRVRAEERRLLLAQRNLQSLRLVAELLGRAEAARLRERAQSEERRRREREAERRRQQEAELRRVEEEKRRALGLQRRERELRQRLVALLLARQPGDPGADPRDPDPGADPGDRAARADDLLRPVLDMLRGVARGRVTAAEATAETGSGLPGAGSDLAVTGSDAVGPGSGGKQTGSDNAGTGSGAGAGSDITEGKGDAVETGSEVRAAGKDRGRGPDDAPPKAAHPAAIVAAGGGDRDREVGGKDRKAREGGGAEEAEDEGGDRERRRGREKDKDRGGRDRKRGRRHREDRDHERSRSRSPRHRPAWSR